MSAFRVLAPPRPSYVPCTQGIGPNKALSLKYASWLLIEFRMLHCPVKRRVVVMTSYSYLSWLVLSLLIVLVNCFTVLFSCGKQLAPRHGLDQDATPSVPASTSTQQSVTISQAPVSVCPDSSDKLVTKVRSHAFQTRTTNVTHCVILSCVAICMGCEVLRSHSRSLVCRVHVEPDP